MKTTFIVFPQLNMARKTPGSGGPRLSSFGKKTNDGDSLSPGDMKVSARMLYKMVGGRPQRTDTTSVGGPSVAPNENAGRSDPGFAKKKRPLFTQKYYRPSTQHPDNLQGNPDARREVVQEGSLN
jgi:HNH endonuclease